LFEFALPVVVEFLSPRAWAYTLLGIQEYLDSFPGDRDVQKVRSALARRLFEMYSSIRSPDWKWFEDVLAYGNARLPQAMLLVGSACSDEHMVSAGLEALDWLLQTQHCETNRHFVPIGSQGFYRQGGEKARFDQQPIEVAGAAKPGRPSTGFLATTICNFLFMIPSPAAAVTACIPIAPMRTRERNRRYRF
jgi:hypothetical protein